MAWTTRRHLFGSIPEVRLQDQADPLAAPGRGSATHGFTLSHAAWTQSRDQAVAPRTRDPIRAGHQFSRPATARCAHSHIHLSTCALNVSRTAPRTTATPGFASPVLGRPPWILRFFRRAASPGLRWLNAGRPPSVRSDKLRRANEAGGLSRMAQIHYGSGRSVMRGPIPPETISPRSRQSLRFSPAAVRVAAPEIRPEPKIELRKRPPTEAASLLDSEKLDQNTGQVWMAVQPPSV